MRVQPWFKPPTPPTNSSTQTSPTVGTADQSSPVAAVVMSRLTRVKPVELNIRLTPFQLNSEQSIFGEPLLASREIIRNQQSIWRKMKQCELLRQLRKSATTLNQFLIMISEIGVGGNEFKDAADTLSKINALVCNTRFSEIILCLRCKNDACEQDKEEMLELRNVLQDHLLMLLSSLKLVAIHSIQKIKGEYVAHDIQQVIVDLENFKVDADLLVGTLSEN